MANGSPYSTAPEVQFRGPSASDDYNTRVENNFRDLIVLYNKSRITRADLQEGYDRLVKDQLSLLFAIQDLENRLIALEGRRQTLSFRHANQVDTAGFAGTPFEISTTNQLTVDEKFGVITLPIVQSATVSKLVFVDSTTGNVTVPSALETTVVGINQTADSSGAIIDTTDPSLAISHQTGRIWQRNVIVGSPTGGGAQLYLYIKCPVDLFSSANSNCILLEPFPALGTDILEIAYTTNPSVLMQDSDGYTALNSTALYDGDQDAIGWLPPGGWVGDTDYNAGPVMYYFDPLPITGLRIKLGQRNYYGQSNQVVYTYGLNNFDLKWTKFISSGSAMIRFDAPLGQTISDITDVEPEIFNVADAELPDIFNYSVIWETSFQSGLYTTTPVPESLRVWIQVNLSLTSGGGSPSVTGLNISYT